MKYTSQPCVGEDANDCFNLLQVTERANAQNMYIDHEECEEVKDHI